MEREAPIFNERCSYCGKMLEKGPHYCSNCLRLQESKRVGVSKIDLFFEKLEAKSGILFVDQ